MTVLHLVRHGQSTWNVEGLLQGQTPHVPLTALGRTQAADAAAELAGARVTAVVTSDLARAQQTAELIAAVLRVPIHLEPGLRERAYGRFEGTPSADVLAETRDVDWTDPDARIGDGESVRAVYERVADALARIRRRYPDAAELVLVSHGDTIRVAAALLEGAFPERIPWRDVPNGSVTTLRWPVRSPRH